MDSKTTVESEKCYIVLMALCDQVIEMGNSIPKLDNQQFNFVFSTDRLFERINGFFRSDTKIKQNSAITKEFISLLFYSFSFTAISGIELGSEEWIYPYPQLKRLLKMYEIDFPILEC